MYRVVTQHQPSQQHEFRLRGKRGPERNTAMDRRVSDLAAKGLTAKEIAGLIPGSTRHAVAARLSRLRKWQARLAEEQALSESLPIEASEELRRMAAVSESLRQ